MFNEIALLIGQFLGATLLLWVLFANVMVFHSHAKETLGLIHKPGNWFYNKTFINVFLGPLAFVGYIVDVLYNLTFATVFYFIVGLFDKRIEYPRLDTSGWRDLFNNSEWVLTARLWRHIKDEDGYTHAISTWVCEYLIEPRDWGHCGLGKHMERIAH